MKKGFAAAAIAATVGLTASMALATPTAITDVASYSGSMGFYNTLSDAQSGTSQVANYVVPRRDMFIGQSADFTYASTAWYYSTHTGQPGDAGILANGRAVNGWGNNGNNTNTGFMQLLDFDGSTRSSISGGWTSHSFEAFNLSVSGSGANSANDAARWWNGTNQAGQAGTFLSYSLDLTFTFNGGANVTAEPGGQFSTTDFNTGVTGTFTAIFQNTSSNPNFNGFYAITLDIGFDASEHWAWNNRDALNQDFLDGEFRSSFFQATVIPLPGAAGMALAGMGMIGLRRRR
jgi:hypothetical protein